VGEEGFEGAVEAAADGLFVADELYEGVSGVVHDGAGEGAVEVAFRGWRVFYEVAVGGFVEEAGLGFAAHKEAPAGFDELADEIRFDGSEGWNWLWYSRARRLKSRARGR